MLFNTLISAFNAVISLVFAALSWVNLFPKAIKALSTFESLDLVKLLSSATLALMSPSFLAVSMLEALSSTFDICSLSSFLANSCTSTRSIFSAHASLTNSARVKPTVSACSLIEIWSLVVNLIDAVNAFIEISLIIFNYDTKYYTVKASLSSCVL